MKQPALLSAAIAIAIVVACGDDKPAETTKAEPVTPPPFEPPVTDVETGAATAGADDPFADEGGWGDEGETEGADETGGDDAAAPPAPERYAGPCKVSWSGGARLRFTWDEGGTGGTVKIDGDRDGKSDVCAKFKSADGRTTEVSIDDGCDKSYESKIVPSYEATGNLATATHTATKEGVETIREITLVALPSFVGVAPGFPLWAAKADVKVKKKKDLVSSAEVKTPAEGPPTKVAFTYDADGRIKRVKEDHEIDGSTDRQFDYTYDDAGNVKRVVLKMGDTKSTAAFDYKCWAKPTEEANAPPPGKAAESKADSKADSKSG